MGFLTPPEAGVQPAQMESTQNGQPQEEGETPTPEEQQAYDQVVAAGSEVLHGDSTHEGIMEMLKTGADNPGDALAEVAMTVLSQLDEQSGGKIPEGVLIPAADDILSQAGELAAAAGLFPWDDQVKQSAAQNLWKKAGEKYDFDPAEIQELIASMDQGEVENIRAEQEQIAMAGSQPQGAPPAPQQAPPMGAV